MKILFVNRMVAIERGGGETFDLEMARHLAQAGCDVCFLGNLPMCRRHIEWKESVPVRILRTPYFGWFPWDKVRGGWRLRVFDFYLFERRAAAWLKKHAAGFDVIQLCELPGTVAMARQKGVSTPMVVRLTAPNYIDQRNGLQAANAVIASGTSLLELKKKLPDCHNIPNAVDHTRFYPHSTNYRETAGIAANDICCLYVARFQAFKNHTMLIDAFAQVVKQVPNAKLLLAGNGPLEKRCRAQVNELGISGAVYFLGEVPFDEIPEVYAASDIKVISSDYESFCFAAIEAMATGLPIVTTDCGWVPKLIHDGQGGLIVPINDADAMADAIIKMAQTDALRKEKGAFNLKTSRDEHSWKRSAEKLLEVYEGVTRDGQQVTS